MTNIPRQPFSRRHGYKPSDREIIIREEAPEEFRAALLHICEVGLRPQEEINRQIVYGCDRIA
jgi:hypothetical protein